MIRRQEAADRSCPSAEGQAFPLRGDGLFIRDFEPHLALFAPGAGHSVLERLLDGTPGLSPGSHLIVEIIRDLASIPRTAVLRRQRV